MKETIIRLVSAVFGFISGLLVPLVKLEVETRQTRNARRKQLITSWREKLVTAEFQSAEGWSSFGISPEYSSLRSHMNQEVIEKFEASRTMYVEGGRGGDVRKQMLHDEISRLEKSWGLS